MNKVENDSMCYRWKVKLNNNFDCSCASLLQYLNILLFNIRIWDKFEDNEFYLKKYEFEVDLK